MSQQKLSRRDFLKAASTAMAAAGFVSLPIGLVRAQDEEVTLSLWGFADNRITWMENLIAEVWQEENPNITIDVETTPYADLWPKLQAAFLGGSGVPDIVDIEISALGQFVREDGSEPYADLSDLLGGDIDDLSVPSATAPWTIRGKIFGVGNEVNPVLLYYRADLFEELGLDAEAPETWAEFVDTLGGPIADAGHALFTIDDNGWADFYIQYHQAGGEFVDAEGNPAFVTDLAAEILAWQKANVESGNFVFSADGDAQYALMNEDAFLTTWGAPWYQGFMKANAPELEGKWKMRYLPLWDENSYLTVPRGGTGMGITNASENKEAAWEFIRVGNLTEEGSLLAFRDLNLFPSYTPVWDAEELKRTDDYFSGQQPGEYIATAAAEMAVVNTGAYWTLLVDAIDRLAVEAVMLEDADPMESLQAALDEFEFNL